VYEKKLWDKNKSLGPPPRLARVENYQHFGLA